MKNIKIDNIEITGLLSSMVASGLPMDSGNLDFASDIDNLELVLELIEEQWLHFSKQNGKILYNDIPLQNNAELIAALLFTDWEIKNNQLYSADFGDFINEADKFTHKLPYVNAERAFNIVWRCKNLGSCPSGEGHNCFLKGINVGINLTAPQYFWLQWERYHFQDTVSSQSTMHKLDAGKEYNQFVSPQNIHTVNTLIEMYNKDASSDEYKKLFDIQPTSHAEKFQAIISNMPEGIMLTRRVTLNYLQLVSMYHQRKNHKLPEWKEFCTWVESLPMFKILTGI